MWWSSGNQVWSLQTVSSRQGPRGEQWEIWPPHSFLQELTDAQCHMPLTLTRLSVHLTEWFSPLKLYQIILFLHSFLKSITSDFSCSRLQAILLCTGPNTQASIGEIEKVDKWMKFLKYYCLTEYYPSPFFILVLSYLLLLLLLLYILFLCFLWTLQKEMELTYECSGPGWVAQFEHPPDVQRLWVCSRAQRRNNQWMHKLGNNRAMLPSLCLSSFLVLSLPKIDNFKKVINAYSDIVFNFYDYFSNVIIYL